MEQLMVDTVHIYIYTCMLTGSGRMKQHNSTFPSYPRVSVTVE
jgi:hypothetical protein